MTASNTVSDSNKTSLRPIISEEAHPDEARAMSCQLPALSTHRYQKLNFSAN